jgi:ATP-dependent exoDNAse (exonuclease V) alpha subunit
MIITAANSDRNQLNQLIRDELLKSGAVHDSQSFKTLTSANITGPTALMADSYKKDQVLILTKDAGDLKVGTQATVLSVNRQDNTLSVQYKENTGAEKQARINLAKDGLKLSTYNLTERQFGVGDSIVFLKNDKRDRGIGVCNGQLGKIKSIDHEGNITAQVGKREVSFNARTGYNYLDHSYALTEYKSQGATVDKLIWHADTNKQISYNSFYVATTRCKKTLSVYTNDATELEHRAGIEQFKYSTLDYAKERLADLKQRSLDGLSILLSNTPSLAKTLENVKHVIDRHLGKARERDQGREHDRGMSLSL